MRARPIKRDKGYRLIVVSAFVVALGLRIALLLTTLDVPGDGPTRAAAAYQWAQHPYVALNGWWPPGFMYLGGLVNLAYPDPLLASRLVSATLGSLTIPVFAGLVRRAFGPIHAAMSAWLLACFPLHAELSASSLTEASNIFAIVAGMLLLMTAMGGRPRYPTYCLGLGCIAWASMTRYEAWGLLPLFVLYIYRQTGKLSTALVAGGLLVTFPIAWTAGNHAASGDPLLGFTLARRGAELGGAAPTAPLAALAQLNGLAFTEIGPCIPLAVGIGLILLLWQAARNGIATDRVFYLSVLGITWGFLVVFGVMRGASLFARYLSFGFVMAFPLAAVPLCAATGRSPRIARILIVLLVASLVFPYLSTRPNCLTREQPHEVQALATWLRGSVYIEDTLLLTEMQWEATYLPLYWPGVASRHYIVSAWLADHELRWILEEKRPRLLITRDDDQAQQQRVAGILGTTLSTRPVHVVGAIDVYELPP